MLVSDPGQLQQDRRLVDGVLRGDEAAFAQFFERFADRLYRLALRHLGGDESEAVEVVHGTLCHALETLDRFRGESSLYTWLHACCRQRARDHLRRRQRLAQREIVSDSLDQMRSSAEGPDDVMDRRNRGLRVHEALDLLPDTYGQVLKLRYFEHMTIQEVAGRLGTTAKAVESRLGRAKRAMRTVLDDLHVGAGGDPA
ncbi:MAG: sigma-70 family RNA polymerase sigma factor [Acidobacteriota bacterium]